MAQSDDVTWARAFMASAGVQIGDDGAPRQRSSQWHEARAAATEPERVRRLAVDRDPGVREGVAGRPDCPLGLLIALAHDRVTDVRVAVAGSGRLSRAVGELLAGDREPAVLKALARNDALPLDLLERLAFHRREEVRRLATRRLDERREFLSRVEDVAPGAIVVRLPGELRDRVAPDIDRLRPA